MSRKPANEQRRSPISRGTSGTVGRFLGTEQEETTRAAIEAQEEISLGKKRKAARDKARRRITIDLSTFENSGLDEQVDALCEKLSIPPSHFSALCIMLGLQAVKNGSLDLEDYFIAYEGRDRRYKHALSLEKQVGS